jgi:hypothetical protein
VGKENGRWACRHEYVLRQPDDAKGVPLDEQRTEICVIACSAPLPAGFIAPCLRWLVFPFRGIYVPGVSPAYPSKKPARPLLTTDGRRVLELLVGSARQGCTEAFLLAHGFTVDLLADMVRAGFATAQIERVRAGGQPIEVTRVHITDAGRQALKGKRTQ